MPLPISIKVVFDQETRNNTVTNFDRPLYTMPQSYLDTASVTPQDLAQATKDALQEDPEAFIDQERFKDTIKAKVGLIKGPENTEPQPSAFVADL